MPDLHKISATLLLSSHLMPCLISLNLY